MMLNKKLAKTGKQNIRKIKIIKSNNISKLSSIAPITNTIIHGDTLQTLKKFPPNKINLIITSPSYMLGKEYDKERSFEEYKKYHSDVIKECHRVLTEDGALYWNVAQTPLENGEILPLGAIFYNILKEKKFYLKNWIIWHFEGGLNAKRRLTGRYENVLWMVKDTNNFVFNLDDIRITSKWDKDKRNNPKGKNPTDFWPVDYVWEINRVVNVSKEKTAHPTQFPEKMIKRVIKASSNKGDIVMDIFSGSGTVMKVAQDEERKWIGIDKESKYCKIAQKRVMSSITK